MLSIKTLKYRQKILCLRNERTLREMSFISVFKFLKYQKAIITNNTLYLEKKSKKIKNRIFFFVIHLHNRYRKRYKVRNRKRYIGTRKTLPKRYILSVFELVTYKQREKLMQSTLY